MSSAYVSAAMTCSASEGSVVVLGEGRCSLVVSISTKVLKGLLAHEDACRIPVLADASNVALRLIKLHKDRVPVEEPTVRRLLQPYVGTIWYINFSDCLRQYVKGQLDHSWAEKIDTCDDAAVMPDFSAPCMRECMTVTCRTTFEIKPKGVWQRPRVVGLASGEEPLGQRWDRHVLVDREKLAQCRFSMMQAHKRQKACKGHQSLSTAPLCRSQYCPNDLLKRRGIEQSLRSLNAMPENNLRILASHVGPLDRGVKSPSIADTEIEVLAAVFRFCDLFDRLVSLQEGRPGAPVLDIALLYEWQLHCGGDMLTEPGGLWFLVDASAVRDGVDCACRSVLDVNKDESQTLPTGTFHVEAPAISFSDAVEAFYVATTAKDLSIIVTLETCRGDPPVNATDARQEAEGHDGAFFCHEVHSITGGKVFVVEPRGDANCEMYYMVRIAVVDIDCKRHKPLSHYYHQDLEIIASFRREKTGRESC